MLGGPFPLLTVLGAATGGLRDGPDRCRGRFRRSSGLPGGAVLTGAGPPGRVVHAVGAETRRVGRG